MLNEYPDVLTVKQVAEILRVSKGTVYDMIHRHEIGCKHIGRKIIVPKSCVVTFLKSAQYSVFHL